MYNWMNNFYRKNNDIEQYWNNKFNETVSEDTTNSDGVSSDHQYSASKQNLVNYTNDNISRILQCLF